MAGHDDAAVGGVDRPDPMPVGRIDHIALVAADADAMAATFRDSLGLTPIHDEVIAATGVRLLWLQGQGPQPEGAARLQIVQPSGPGPIADHLRTEGEGFHHLCFDVGDVGQHLVGRGQSPDEVFVGGFGLPCAFLRDRPSGTLIELVQRPETSGPSPIP